LGVALVRALALVGALGAVLSAVAAPPAGDGDCFCSGVGVEFAVDREGDGFDGVVGDVEVGGDLAEGLGSLEAVLDLLLAGGEGVPDGVRVERPSGVLPGEAIVPLVQG
jgi:hypothetical protein